MSESTRPPSLGPTALDPAEVHETVRAEDGTRLFVRSMPRRGAPAIAGAAPTTPTTRVIFCDGILCDGFIWKYLWGDVAAVADVAHWHYRGHGRSGAPADPAKIDIAAHAADLMSVRAHLGDPPCVLVGHSMGTQVALESWKLFPRNVLGLVLLCGSYGHVTQSFRGVPILDALLPKLMSVVDKQPDLARAIWTRIPPEMAFKAALLMGDMDPGHVRREDVLPYLKHMTHVDFPMFLRMLRAAGDHSAETFLSKIDVPVLVVAGEKDTFTPSSLSSFMAEEIPDCELLTVKGGSHAAPIERPDLVDPAVTAFVERASLR